MSTQTPSLEPGRDVRSQWLDIFTGLVQDSLDDLATGPAVGVLGSAAADVAEAVSRPIPEEPLPGGPEGVAELIRAAAGAGVVPPGPGYFAYVPGSGLFAAALADLVAGCLNRFSGLTSAAPAFCRLEWDVIAWLAREFGYGPRARGLLLSGGSLATLAAVATARHALLGDTGDHSRSIAYTSTQAHHCVPKALRLAGIPAANLRMVPVDGEYRLRTDALEAAVAADRAAGLTPFLVIATAGTTNTGSLDPLDSVADLCAAERLWLHVDAAYGGGFVLCPEGRRLLAGIERADSITFDPHKGMFVPFGTGALLVRDGERLLAAHASGAGYLQDFDALDRTREAPSPMAYGPELSRSYRGLRLWLPLMLHGARAFRDALAEKLELAHRFHAGLLRLIAQGVPLECVGAPQTSTIALRAERRGGETLDAWNAASAALLDAVNRRKRVYLSSTTLPVVDGEAFTLRVCVLGMRTHAQHVDTCLADLEAACEELERDRNRQAPDPR